MKKENISSMGTVIASLLATSCCIGPAIFVVFGTSIGFSGKFSALEPIRPYLLSAAFLMLGFSFWKLYLKKADCTCEEDIRARKIARVILWIGFAALIFAVSLLESHFMDLRMIGGVIMINKWSLSAFALFFLFAVSVGAAEQTVVVDIEGMTCNLCAVAVKKSLSKTKGVKEAKTSFKEKRAWMTVNEEVTDAAITEAVQKAGRYEVKGISRRPVTN